MREKYKGREFIAEPLSECKTFREQVQRYRKPNDLTVDDEQIIILQ